MTMARIRAAYYEVGANIQAGGGDFTPVGTCASGTTCGTYFTGSFNGRGFAIFDLTINRTQYWNGLFGQLSSNATISNIRLDNFNINTGNASNTGVIAGRAENSRRA